MKTSHLRCSYKFTFRPDSNRTHGLDEYLLATARRPTSCLGTGSMHCQQGHGDRAQSEIAEISRA
ncbi:hypothetical protein GC197_16705 [bacterium]|nr:hypothetical protein [bacterium]